MAGDESFELSAYGLETVALPTELIPYMKLYKVVAHRIYYGGPSGTRTPDRPVMSRLL